MKVGIVGSGKISEIHLALLARLPATEVIGIADIDIAKARAASRRYGIARAYSSLTDLLGSVTPEAVHVLTPPATHSALAIEALDAGAHVYVEKPMAVTSADCAKMESAAARARKQLCVGHCMAYGPLLNDALDLIEEGKAGDLLQASVSIAYDVTRNPDLGKDHWTDALPGGLLEDLAVHPLSVLIRLLGAPKSMHAVVKPDRSTSNHSENVSFLLDQERGIGTAMVSLGARPDMQVVNIWCTKMHITIQVDCTPLMSRTGRRSVLLGVGIVSWRVPSLWQPLRLETAAPLRTLQPAVPRSPSPDCQLPP